MVFKPVGVDENGKFPTRVEEALSATYAGKAETRTIRRGARMAHLGDSLSSAVSGGDHAHWAWLLPVLLDGQLARVVHAGVPGDRSTQILARVPSVVASGVRYATVLSGANDTGTVAETTATLRQIYDQLRAGGVEPLPMLMIPNNVAGRPDFISQVNAWISAYGERNGMTVLDSHTPLVQATGANVGQFITGYNSDTTHMTQAGHIALARALATQLDGKLSNGGWKPLLTSTSSGISNLAGDGLLSTVSGTAGIAAGWTQASTTAGGTWSLVPVVPATDKITGGNWQRIAIASGTTGTMKLRKAVTRGSTTFEAGDRLSIAMRLRTGGGWEDVGITNWYQATVYFNGSTDPEQAFVRQWAADVTNGLVYTELTVPADGTDLRLELWVTAATAAGHAQNVDFGAITIRNLTKLGALA